MAKKTNVPQRITSKMLKQMGACVEQRRKFSRVFGVEGAPLTLAAATKAIKNGLPFWWIINRTLPLHHEQTINRLHIRTPEYKAWIKADRTRARGLQVLRKKIIDARNEFDAKWTPQHTMYSDKFFRARQKDPKHNAAIEKREKYEAKWDPKIEALSRASDIALARIAVPHIKASFKAGYKPSPVW